MSSWIEPLLFLNHAFNIYFNTKVFRLSQPFQYDVKIDSTYWVDKLALFAIASPIATVHRNGDAVRHHCVANWKETAQAPYEVRG